MNSQPSYSPRRAVIWSFLVVNPGRTAYEIGRAVLGRNTGPTSAAMNSGADAYLLARMERDGQVTRRREYRAQQGREVSVWFAVPGAFAVADSGVKPGAA